MVSQKTEEEEAEWRTSNTQAGPPKRSSAISRSYSTTSSYQFLLGKLWLLRDSTHYNYPPYSPLSAQLLLPTLAALALPLIRNTNKPKKEEQQQQQEGKQLCEQLKLFDDIERWMGQGAGYGRGVVDESRVGQQQVGQVQQH